jgi:hypothetical protein
MQPLLGLPPPRRRLTVLVGALALAALLYALVGRGPGAPRGLGCQIDVALAVPRLDAAPLLLAAAVRQRGQPTCRLRLVTGAAAARAPLALLSGDAWAGLQPSDRVPFLLVAQRVGALLVSRQPVAPHFLWHGVKERVLVLSRASGDLGPTVVDAMLDAHAVPSVAVLRGLGAAAFRAGTGDYLELPLWPAERLLASGRAHFATDLAIQGGPLPAAVLAASPVFARAEPARLTAVAIAVARAEAALLERPAAMAARWPGRLSADERKALALALARARYEHLWPSDPRLERSLFVRLDVLRQAAGQSAFAPPAVLTAPAEAALRRLAPPRGG